LKGQYSPWWGGGGPKEKHNKTSSILGREACLGFYVGEVPHLPAPHIPKILVVGLSNGSMWKKTNPPPSPSPALDWGYFFMLQKKELYG